MVGISVFGQTFEQQLVGSASSDATNTELQLTWSLGEAAIFVQENSVLQISAGFLQGTLSSVCLGDFDGSGSINSGDLIVFLSDFNCVLNCTTDLNNDDEVNILDLLVMLEQIGSTCP